MTATGPTLRIQERFVSVQGEGILAGMPSSFVRLTGCPQRCVWCDTEYAFSGGEKWSLEAILPMMLRPLGRWQS